jgi:hypothetical protein
MAVARRPGYPPPVRRSIPFSSPTLLVSTLALFSASLGSSLGCKQEEPKIAAADYPGEMAGGYCNAVFSCQCEDYPYASPNECFADLLEAYDIVNDEAFLSGLLYDGTCPAAELSEIESLACRGAIPEVPSNICVPPCNVWHGNLGAGYPCQVLASSAELGLAWSTCAQGLICQGEVCVNPCMGTGPLPAIGQPCPQGVCAAGAVCDETMTCVAAPVLPGAGQPCLDGACATGTVCVAAANTCATLPTTGQPCLENQCDINSVCDSGLCIAKPPLACFLLGGGGIPGDGDGDTGDGDGDTGDGDGDGDGDGACSPTAMPAGVPSAWGGDSSTLADNHSGSCSAGAGPEDVLTWVAPGAGLYQISTVGSTYDTIVYVRDGGDCMGAELACDDDTIAPQSQLEVTLEADQEITIFVDSFSEAGGTYAVTITLI